MSRTRLRSLTPFEVQTLQRLLKTRSCPDYGFIALSTNLCIILSAYTSLHVGRSVKRRAKRLKSRPRTRSDFTDHYRYGVISALECSDHVNLRRP
ncbi:hypothetical protein Plhal710r2_c020g0084351 [Plasmopara halstedii]